MGEERYKRGWDRLKEINGEAGEKVIESLKDVSPDLGRYRAMRTGWSIGYFPSPVLPMRTG